jgi:hypothetical protein
MRPKVAIIVIALGLFVFGTLFAIRQNVSRPTKNSEPTISSATQPTNTLAAAKAEPVTERAAAAPGGGIPPKPAATASTEDAHQAYVEKRTAELMDIAMTDDRANLDTILSELGNRDPEIRKAALDATIQFGSRDAIPKLADAASQTDDPNEKAALADAIEFLKLPSLTEVRQQQAANSVANTAASGSRPTRKAGFGKRNLPAPVPAPNQ